MIQFNELRITSNKTLIIDVSVKDNPNYTNIYIDQIRIDSHNTYSGLGPSSTPIYEYSVASNDNLKVLRLNINEDTLQDIKLSDNLLFIYVTAKGLPVDDEIEEGDTIHNMMTITDLEPIYKSIIKLISNQGEHCKDNSKLIDYILKINALDIALKTCNYPIAVKYWSKFFSRSKLDRLTLKCNQK